MRMPSDDDVAGDLEAFLLEKRAGDAEDLDFARVAVIAERMMMIIRSRVWFSSGILLIEWLKSF